MLSGETICAPATQAGTGAIAIVRVSGPGALRIADSVATCKRGVLSDTPSQTMRYVTIPYEDGPLDEGLAAVFRAPHSYTGEDCVEFYCHASSYIVSRLLELLCRAGCRMARPGEFTQRAFICGKMDLPQAEAVADLIAASSRLEHRVAASQMRGGYSLKLKELRDCLLRLSALMELELDFSEEQVEFADREALVSICSEAVRECSRLAESFRTGNAIRSGVPVAIVGAPNSGKSTLLNALLQEDRAIVSPVAGTTRDTVEEVCEIGGVKFRFIDTAGIRDADEGVEKIGIERSYGAISKADFVLALEDGTQERPSGCGGGKENGRRYDGGILEDIVQRIDFERQHFAVLRTKCDLADFCPKLPLIERDKCCNKKVINGNKIVSCTDYKIFTLKISAKSGEGLDVLKKWLSDTVVGACLSSKAENDAASVAGAGDILVTNARHAAALSAASESLSKVLDGLRSPLPCDLLAEDLRDAISHLGAILGEYISPDEVLGEIFGKFCIGK